MYNGTGQARSTNDALFEAATAYTGRKVGGKVAWSRDTCGTGMASE